MGKFDSDAEWLDMELQNVIRMRFELPMPSTIMWKSIKEMSTVIGNIEPIMLSFAFHKVELNPETEPTFFSTITS